MPRKTPIVLTFFHSSTARYAKSAGFTLMELMVTVVIIGVVVAVAISNLSQVRTDTDFDSTYSQVRNSFNRCRAAAMNAANPATTPTALAFYPNGFACVAWRDINLDRHIGAPGALPSATGTVAVGDASGEIVRVFFVDRFSRSEDLFTLEPHAYLDFAHADSLLPLDGDALSGQHFILSPSGFIMAPDRTFQIGGAGTEARLVLNRPPRTPAWLSVLPSGQLNGG